MNEETRERASQLEGWVNPKHRELHEGIQAGKISPAELSQIIDQDGVVPECLTVGGFEARLQYYLENGIGGTLVAIDVDDFKGFNDKEGHPAGDDLLRLAGNIFYRQTRIKTPTPDQEERRHSVNQQLDLLGRAGDEFLWYLVGASTDDAVEAALRVRANLGIGVRLYFPNFGPDQNMSLGVTLVQSSDDVRALRQRADQALYQAKKSKGLPENTGIVVK